MRALILGMAFALTLSSPALATELITNGGFATPSISTSPGYETFYSNGSSSLGIPATIMGWTVTDNSVDIVNSFGGSVAYEGSQYLDLVGFGSTGSIAQSFATVAGQTYRLRFAYSHNVFSTGSAAAAFSVGNLLDSVSHSSGNGGNLDWRLFNGTFVAGAGNSSTLTFQNTAGGGNGGLFLDAVSVAAVPEPATWGLMILGFGAIGGAMRSRRRQTARVAAGWLKVTSA